MIKLSIFLVLLLCFSSPVYAGSTDTAQKQELTDEQKNEVAKQMGVVLIGMTKDDIRETFGLLKPKIWHTPEGQEVWHYNVPEPHDIYFKDDKVDYTPEPVKPDKTQPKEI